MFFILFGVKVRDKLTYLLAGLARYPAKGRCGAGFSESLCAMSSQLAAAPDQGTVGET